MTFYSVIFIILFILISFFFCYMQVVQHIRINVFVTSSHLKREFMQDLRFSCSVELKPGDVATVL